MTLKDREIILDIQNLRTKFATHDGVVHAVNGVSYQVHAGETLAIVGESGCGKSVSMLSVIRLLPAPPAQILADAINFQGKDLMSFSNSEMRRIRGNEIAMIFQDPMTSLNPVLTIGLQITEALKLHMGLNDEQATKRAAELLALVEMPDAASRLDNYPHQFSGGMRQRVMIAIALSCNPTLLIADEPTTALDVTVQAQLVDLVKQLQNKLGMALIWISHDLGVVAGLAERVIVMYAGFVVEDALVDDLYTDPRHPYTAALLRSLPREGGSESLEVIEGLPPGLKQEPVGCPFAPRCSFARDKCREQNPSLEAFGPQHKAACWIDIRTGELK
ncbi:MAG: ABC transporter ATP-binding protein [Chloroflexi bacterium]|nr:ABC transporter ATP-binding protein [Chloroflexota bacterium]